MTIKRIFSLLAFLQIFIITSLAQTTINIPAAFVETIPPKVGSKEWYTLNYSKNEFGVKIIDGKLDIAKTKEMNKCDLQISRGILTGIDNGEWGGQLTFQPTDTTKRKPLLKGET